MSAPLGHEDEQPLDSPDDFPVDADDTDATEGAPWADGPGHVGTGDLPPPVEGVGNDLAAVPDDEVPPSPS